MNDSRKLIRSVSEAIERLREIESDDELYDQSESPFHKFPFGLWFRGHFRDTVKLEPRVFRDRLPERDQSIIPPTGRCDGEGLWDETNVFEHLKLRVPSHEHIYHTAFDWLCLMQHYSVPTRLLDWSESILPALYFAVKDDEKSDGELIALNAYRLNSISKPHPTISTPDDYRVVIRAEMAGTRSSRTLKLQKTVIEALNEAPEEERADNKWTNFRRPIAVFPRRLNERMILQSSVFTLHGGKHYVRGMEEKRYKDESLPLPISLEEIDEERPHGSPILERFLIRCYDKREILRDLFRMGIHEGTLFPEVDRQAIYLQHCWWYANED